MIRAAVVAVILVAMAGAETPVTRWQGIEFLFGKWTAVGGAHGSVGSGGFSFERDLDARIVVRRNFAKLESGARHDDLMVIYAEGPGDAMSAMYFDSEGHVIRYKVSTPGKDRVTFEAEGGGPRLSYWMEGKALKGKFEVGGRTYLEWSAVRSQ